MFADDCIIFSKASNKVCSTINSILHDFCAMSSQLVNFHKSFIQISNNIQGASNRRIGEVINIPISNRINKYLRCPIFQGKAKRDMFSEVILKSQNS